MRKILKGKMIEISKEDTDLLALVDWKEDGHGHFYYEHKGSLFYLHREIAKRKIEKMATTEIQKKWTKLNYLLIHFKSPAACRNVGRLECFQSFPVALSLIIYISPSARDKVSTWLIGVSL